MSRTGFPALAERLNARMPEQERMEAAVWLYFVAEQLEDTDAKNAVTYTTARLRTIAEQLTAGNDAPNHPLLDRLLAEADYAPSRDDSAWLEDMTAELQQIDIDLGGLLAPVVTRLTGMNDRTLELLKAMDAMVSHETHQEVVDELQEMEQERDSAIERAEALEGELELARFENRRLDLDLPDHIKQLFTMFTDASKVHRMQAAKALGDWVGEELTYETSPVREAILAAVNDAVAAGTLSVKKRTDG